YVHYRNLLSFPTRRSSDLKNTSQELETVETVRFVGFIPALSSGLTSTISLGPFFHTSKSREQYNRFHKRRLLARTVATITAPHRSEEQRLNSSHVKISYAV